MIIITQNTKYFNTQLYITLLRPTKLLCNLSSSLNSKKLRFSFHKNIPDFVIDPFINNRYSNEKSSIFHIISQMT